MSISTLIEGANFFCRLTIELTLGIAWHNDALNQIDTYGSVPSRRSAILENLDLLSLWKFLNEMNRNR